MTRLPTALLLTLAVAGCSSGLEGNVTLTEAEANARTELLDAVHAEVSVEPAELVMDSRLWVPWGSPVEEAPEARAVGTHHGITVYARSWDRAPLEALFVRTDEGWQGYAPVIGRPGTPGATADH